MSPSNETPEQAPHDGGTVSAVGGFFAGIGKSVVGILDVAGRNKNEDSKSEDSKVDDNDPAVEAPLETAASTASERTVKVDNTATAREATPEKEAMIPVVASTTKEVEKPPTQQKDYKKETFSKKHEVVLTTDDEKPSVEEKPGVAAAKKEDSIKKTAAPVKKQDPAKSPPKKKVVKRKDLPKFIPGPMTAPSSEEVWC